MFEQIYALPRAKHELPIHHRHIELHLRERGLEMRRHVVGAFVVVVVEPLALGGQFIEEMLEIAAHGRRGVLLDQQRGRGVTAEQCEHAG